MLPDARQRQRSHAAGNSQQQLLRRRRTPLATASRTECACIPSASCQCLSPAAQRKMLGCLLAQLPCHCTLLQSELWGPRRLLVPLQTEGEQSNQEPCMYEYAGERAWSGEAAAGEVRGMLSLRRVQQHSRYSLLVVLPQILIVIGFVCTNVRTRRSERKKVESKCT